MNWQFTTDEEFDPAEFEEYGCMRFGAGDYCDCMDCVRMDTEWERKNTEEYWRERIARESK